MNAAVGPTIRLLLDPTNPGQFFACCGLLEVASRLSEAAEAWFEDESFVLSGSRSLKDLLSVIAGVQMIAVDPDAPTTSPLRLCAPIGLRLDWWLDTRAGGSLLKTWAGRQKVVSIALAMQAALEPSSLDEQAALGTSAVLYDSDGEKVEPFYFDARRAAQSHNLDVGFSPDAQKMLTPVFSAVEFLCLLGLQRFRPDFRRDARQFEYVAWGTPLSAAVASAAAAGHVACPGRRFRFRLLYRTKYLKGFMPATSINGADGGNARD